MHGKKVYPQYETSDGTKKSIGEYVGSESSLKRKENKNILELQKKHHETRMDLDK